MDIKRFEYILNNLVDKGDINLNAEIRLKELLKDEYNIMKGNCNHIWNAINNPDINGECEAICIKCNETGGDNFKKIIK